MKTPIRFQSRLLLRRSYKPARVNRRALGITFRPASRFDVSIAPRKNVNPSPPDDADSTSLSG
ncbi:MAG: hypothetical protein JWR19_2481 [Pedosphaera sp.]|nr:hypothetical protein [Pedosphaera sp.]